MNFARPEVFEFWPTDILRIFQKAGMIRRIPPPFHPDCNMDEETAGFPPAITSPVSGVEYSVRSVGDESIAFSATADGGVRRIFWFVNDTLAGSSPVDSPFFWPAKPGNFSVRVVDDRGLSDTRDMHVTVTQ